MGTKIPLLLGGAQLLLQDCFFQKKNGENFANISLLFRISSDLPPVSMGRIGKVCGPPMEEVYKDQSLFEGLDCPGLPPQKRTPVLFHVDMIEALE